MVSIYGFRDSKVRANTGMDVEINQYRHLHRHAVVAQKWVSCGPAAYLLIGVNLNLTGPV